MQQGRDAVAAGLSGTVLEIGFGSGLNVASYPPEIELVYAVEPALTARKIAVPRIAASPIPIQYAGLHGETVALDDNSCDGAMCTFTLCTIPGVEQALAELRRVLKPGSRFHFLEHGLAPDAKTRTWQRRLDPLQERALPLVGSAGFELEFVHSEYTKGPKPWVFMTFGQAINPA